MKKISNKNKNVGLKSNDSTSDAEGEILFNSESEMKYSTRTCKFFATKAATALHFHLDHKKNRDHSAEKYLIDQRKPFKMTKHVALNFYFST